MERAPGFYWLRDAGTWTIGEWLPECLWRDSDRNWAVVGSDLYHRDDDFEAIGARIEKPAAA